MKLFLIYLAIVNAVAFLLMLIDKIKACRGMWRISEATLIGSAVIGGSVGALVAMHLARHKTRHAKFTIGIPVILALQIVVGLAVYWIFW